MYLEDEWTRVFDVGKSFDGEVLTFENYRKIEDAYVSIILSFGSESGFDMLIVTYLETQQLSQNLKTQAKNLKTQAKNLQDIAFNSKLIRKEMALSGDALADVCRLVLREIFWCKLEFGSDFYIHFGWDYYMYVGSSVFCKKSIAYAKQQGLFVEEKESPYSCRDEA